MPNDRGYLIAQVFTIPGIFLMAVLQDTILLGKSMKGLYICHMDNAIYC